MAAETGGSGLRSGGLVIPTNAYAAGGSKVKIAVSLHAQLLAGLFLLA